MNNSVYRVCVAYAFALSSLLLCARNAQAVSPGYYLVTTYDEEGEKTAEFDFWSAKSGNAPAVNSPEIGYGYGVTSRWYTELFAADVHTANGGTAPNNIAWQNDYMLTQGQYPIDVAVHTLLKRYHETDSGTGFEFGPVLQTEIGKTQLNGNVFFERNYQTDTPNSMQIKYQWQAKYLWTPQYRFGLQGFGELGEWNRWLPHDQQSHRAGPTASALWRLDGERQINLDASYLIGTLFGKQAKVFIVRAQVKF